MQHALTILAEKDDVKPDMLFDKCDLGKKGSVSFADFERVFRMHGIPLSAGKNSWWRWRSTCHASYLCIVLCATRRVACTGTEVSWAERHHQVRRHVPWSRPRRLTGMPPSGSQMLSSCKQQGPPFSDLIVFALQTGAPGPQPKDAPAEGAAKSPQKQVAAGGASPKPTPSGKDTIAPVPKKYEICLYHT